MMQDSDAAIEVPRRRHVYGRRRGKRLRAHQAGLVENFLPEISIALPDMSAGAAAPRLDPATLFSPDCSEVWLEIGFGGGEHLIHQAQTHPHVGIMGCEPFINGVAKLVVEIEDRRLDNVRLHADDARQLLECLKPESLARVFILYPDPWPKARHNKRRFINQETLRLLAAAMKPGSELRFASDIPDYIDWTMAHIADFNEESGPRFERVSRNEASPYEGWPGTRYEDKALKAGRVPTYLAFERV